MKLAFVMYAIDFFKLPASWPPTIRPAQPKPNLDVPYVRRDLKYIVIHSRITENAQENLELTQNGFFSRYSKMTFRLTFWL